MSGVYLHLHRLAVGYRGRALIQGIEIGVRRGEIVTLVGPNGAGKSTILKTITRQLEPVDGEVLLDWKSAGESTELSGSASTELSESAERGIPAGSVFGAPEMKNLLKSSPGELARRMAVVLTGRIRTELMTCRDVTAMGRYPYTGRLGILSRQDEKKVDQALAAVHAEHLADRSFDAVSDGERQRILLARAICQEPEIIVLDEPTSFLDIRHKLELLSILHKMAKQEQITVVMSLHETDLAMKISDRILCVKGDRIFACGPPEEVLDDEVIRRLYDLDPALGSFDTRTGSLELHFVKDREEEKAAEEPVQRKYAEDTAPSLPRVLIAAPGSGSGKTLVTCGILRLLQKKGFRPSAFKCGPDYIDPMFHRQVLGIPSRNLDTFFSPDGQAFEILQKAVRKNRADIAVIEGVMGYFDGTGQSGMEASSFDLAVQTRTPVILVVNAKGMGRSVVPLIKGLGEYEAGAAEKLSMQTAEKATATSSGRIRGVILNRISPGMAPVMKKWIEEETGLPVVGYLPQDTSFSWGSRHLGLLQPQEIADFQKQIDRLADTLEKTLDTERLLEIGREASGSGSSIQKEPAKQSLITEKNRQRSPVQQECADTDPVTDSPVQQECADTDPVTEDPLPTSPVQRECADTDPVTDSPVRIAVARDEAFNFYYEDNLELLQECGAEPVFFSPIHDRELPEADGLILGGGYPELHARALADNRQMKEQIRTRAEKGMPVLAECGGFMYLQEYLEISSEDNPDPAKRDSGKQDSVKQDSAKRDSARQDPAEESGKPQNVRKYAMCGILEGTCRKTDRLVRFGYIGISPKTEADFVVRGHEFHYFDSTDNGAYCTAVKPGGKRRWDCMVVQGNVIAGFPHLYYRSNPAFIRRFLDRCRMEAACKKKNAADRSCS